MLPARQLPPWPGAGARRATRSRSAATSRPSALPAPPPVELCPPLRADRLRASEIAGLWKTSLLENPLLGRSAQPGEFIRIRGFGIDSHDGLGSRQAVTNPGTILEYQLQAVFANHLPDLAAEEFLGLRP